MNVNVIQKVEEGVERTAIPPLAATHGSEVEPLKSVEWQFPLGGGVARLSIVSNEITPADMDALQEMSTLIKRQLERRAQRGTVKLLCKICGQSWDEAHTVNGDKCPNANPPNESSSPTKAGRIAWFGDMGDGSKAPENSDTVRLDWMENHPGLVKNMKSGVQSVGINVWQPGLRPAIDAAMELVRRELRAKGLEPVW